MLLLQQQFTQTAAAWPRGASSNSSPVVQLKVGNLVLTWFLFLLHCRLEEVHPFRVVAFHVSGTVTFSTGGTAFIALLRSLVQVAYQQSGGVFR